jgi:hypothetical protein
MGRKIRAARKITSAAHGVRLSWRGEEAEKKRRGF